MAFAAQCRDPSSPFSSASQWAKTIDRFGGRESLEGVSVTGQSETLIALDRDGRELGSAIVWLDTRGESELPELSKALPTDALYEATGNTGLDPVMPLLKLPWMRKNEPERYAAAEKFLLIKEYIVCKLTGQIVAEHSAQSCSGYFNIRALDWEDGILHLAGIGREKLPELADSQHVVGGLCAEARRAGRGAASTSSPSSASAAAHSRPRVPQPGPTRRPPGLAHRDDAAVLRGDQLGRLHLPEQPGVERLLLGSEPLVEGQPVLQPLGGRVLDGHDQQMLSAARERT